MGPGSFPRTLVLRRILGHAGFFDLPNSRRHNQQRRPICRALAAIMIATLNRALRVLVWLMLIALSGCLQPTGPEVVVYTALDEPFSRPQFERFTATTGVAVRAKFDTESTKTVGLVEAIIAESDRPRCDVFWNNEILHTIRLERRGLLEPIQLRAAAAYPEAVRAADGSWHGFAARARVLIVNRDNVSANDFPQSILDLAQPQPGQRVGIAKPLYGTTATHAACLFATWGPEQARAFFLQLKETSQILAGNKQVAREVAEGRLDFGLTDTDDAIVEIEQGFPVEIVYPDQLPSQLGTLFIPNTLAVLRNGPHPKEARQLVEFLLSAQTEAELAAGPSAQIPLRMDTEGQARIESPRTIRAMEVDFTEAAAAWDGAVDFLRKLFATE